MKSTTKKEFFTSLVITGGVIGYMDIQVKEGTPFEQLAKQCEEYNKAQEELGTGCKMHLEICTVTTETDTFEF